MYLGDILFEVHIFPEYKHHRDNTRGPRVNSAHNEVRCKDGLMQARHDGHREIPGYDAVHRNCQWNDKYCKKSISPVQAVPLFVSSAPSQRE